MFKVLLVSLFSFVTAPEMEQANNAYMLAQEAQTVAVAEEQYNLALKNYHLLEKEYSPNLSDGKLFFNIGNTYYALNEYPLAVYYYYRSLSLRPRDENVIQNLNLSLKELNLPLYAKNSVQILSIPEQLQLLSLFALCLFLAVSFYIWFPKKTLKNFAIAFCLLCILFALSLTYYRFFKAPEAVILQAVLLKRDNAENAPSVDSQPLLPGTKVKVTEVLSEGKWLKVTTQEEKVGYVSFSTARLI